MDFIPPLRIIPGLQGKTKPGDETVDQIRQIIRQELARLLGEGAGATPPAAGGWGGAPDPPAAGGWGGAPAQAYAPPAAGGWTQGGDFQPAARPAAQPGAAPSPGEAQRSGNLQEDYRELTRAMSQNLQKLQFVLQETSEITRKVEQLLWEASRAEQKLKRNR